MPFGLKGTWSIKNAFVTVCYKMHMVKQYVLKVEYNDRHKFASKLRGFPLYFAK